MKLTLTLALFLAASPAAAFYPSRDFEPDLQADADSFSRDVDAMRQRELMQNQADQMRRLQMQQFDMQQQIERQRMERRHLPSLRD